MKYFVPVTILGAVLFTASLHPIGAQSLRKSATTSKSLPENAGPLTGGSVTDPAALEMLDDPKAEGRATILRRLGDRYPAAPDRQPAPITAPLPAAIQNKLITLARGERDSTVRAELARLAGRLPAVNALPILRELFARMED